MEINELKIRDKRLKNVKTYAIYLSQITMN